MKNAVMLIIAAALVAAAILSAVVLFVGESTHVKGVQAGPGGLRGDMKWLFVGMPVSYEAAKADRLPMKGE